MSTGLIAALDTTDAAQAQEWAKAVAPHCGLLKLGLEFFLAHGAEGLRSITQRPIFLDLKLHDIPNTAAGGVRAVLPLRPAMLTLHASGGSAMIAAARKEAEKAGAERPILLAVTVLTSMDTEALHAIGVAGGPRQQVLRLARMVWSARRRKWRCCAMRWATNPSSSSPASARQVLISATRPA